MSTEEKRARVLEARRLYAQQQRGGPRPHSASTSGETRPTTSSPDRDRSRPRQRSPNTRPNKSSSRSPSSSPSSRNGGRPRSGASASSSSPGRRRPSQRGRNGQHGSPPSSSSDSSPRPRTTSGSSSTSSSSSSATSPQRIVNARGKKAGMKGRIVSEHLSTSPSKVKVESPLRREFGAMRLEDEGDDKAPASLAVTEDSPPVPPSRPSLHRRSHPPSAAEEADARTSSPASADYVRLLSFHGKAQSKLKQRGSEDEIYLRPVTTGEAADGAPVGSADDHQSNIAASKHHYPTPGIVVDSHTSSEMDSKVASGDEASVVDPASPQSEGADQSKSQSQPKNRGGVVGLFRRRSVTSSADSRRQSVSRQRQLSEASADARTRRRSFLSIRSNSNPDVTRNGNQGSKLKPSAKSETGSSSAPATQPPTRRRLPTQSSDATANRGTDNSKDSPASSTVTLQRRKSVLGRKKGDDARATKELPVAPVSPVRMNLAARAKMLSQKTKEEKIKNNQSRPRAATALPRQAGKARGSPNRPSSGATGKTNSPYSASRPAKSALKEPPRARAATLDTSKPSASKSKGDDHKKPGITVQRPKLRDGQPPSKPPRSPPPSEADASSIKAAVGRERRSSARSPASDETPPEAPPRITKDKPKLKSEDDILQEALEDLKDWERGRDDIRFIDKRLGKGFFGYVEEARLNTRDGSGELVVAIKSVRSDAPADSTVELIREAMLMKQLASPGHENVLAILGVVFKSRPLLLIVEHCGGGDLLTLLRRGKVQKRRADSLELSPGSSSRSLSVSTAGKRMSHSNSVDSLNGSSDASGCSIDAIRYLDETELLSFARQIAAGMTYLSEHNFVHRDLACRNVLVTNQHVCKISDYGLARFTEDGVYMKHNIGHVPFKWMSPEALTVGEFTSMSDVWSFGVVLWEIFSLGEKPYPTVSNERITEYILCGNRLTKPISCSKALYQIMHDCWNIVPEHRPTFSDLKARLDKVNADVRREKEKERDKGSRNLFTRLTRALQRGGSSSEKKVHPIAHGKVLDCVKQGLITYEEAEQLLASAASKSFPHELQNMDLEDIAAVAHDASEC